MLRTTLGSSKHSTAFRRAMAKEISPLRSYSVEQQTQQPISRLTTTKKYLKNLQTENSKESEKMLKIFRKAGALSIVAVLGSLGMLFMNKISKIVEILRKFLIENNWWICPLIYHKI